MPYYDTIEEDQVVDAFMRFYEENPPLGNEARIRRIRELYAKRRRETQ